MLSPFLLCLAVFTGVLFIARVLKLVELVVNKSVPVLDVALLFSYIIPSFLEMALPMALLLGTQLAFSRLSADSELVVMRAVGVSFRGFLLPPFIFSLLVASFCFALAFWIRPAANYRLGMGMFQIAKERASSGLTSGVFTNFGPLTIYAEEVDSTSGRLNNVLISDRRDRGSTKNFFAKYGEMISDPVARTLSLRLFDGSIQEGGGTNFTVTDFNINHIKVPQDELLDADDARSGNRPSELSIVRLIDRVKYLEETQDIRQWSRAKVELHRRYMLPFSCIIVAILGVSLGVQPSRGSKTWGASANAILGILFIIIYYILVAIFVAISEKHPQWCEILMWVPNLIFAAISLFLMRKIETERWQSVSQALVQGGQKIWENLSRRFRSAEQPS